MVGKATAERFHDALPGIKGKTLVRGAETLLTKFLLAEGSVLPLHDHPYEQTGYLISGRLRLTVGGESFEAGPGDSWCIARGVAHRADVLEDSVALELFSPPREDYAKWLDSEDLA